MEEKFYTINQIAEKLDMHHKTIRKFITEGKLGASKVGKQWRISEPDLKNFMGNNHAKLEIERNEEQGIEFSVDEISAHMEKKRVNVSTVVDMDEMDKEQYMRISNTLIAFMNSRKDAMQNSTLNVKYYENEKNLKILLWGEIKFTEEMLKLITLLME